MLNPNRPDIWIPATVKEIMEAMLDYHRIKREIDRINQEKTLVAWAAKNFKPDPSRVMTATAYDEIKKEYEKFTADDLIVRLYQVQANSLEFWGLMPVAMEDRL